LHRRLGSLEGLADTQRIRAEALLASGRAEEADAVATTSLETARRVDSPYFIGSALRCQARTSAALGRDRATVRALLDEALAVFDAAGLEAESRVTRSVVAEIAT